VVELDDNAEKKFHDNHLVEHFTFRIPKLQLKYNTQLQFIVSSKNARLIINDALTMINQIQRRQKGT